MSKTSFLRRSRPALTLLSLATATAAAPLASAVASETDTSFVEQMNDFGASIVRAAGQMEKVFMPGGHVDLVSVGGAAGIALAGIIVLRVLARCLGGSSDGPRHRRPVQPTSR